MKILVTSASHECGNKFTVALDGNVVEVPGERGIGLVVFEKETKKANFVKMFDTYADPSNCSKMCEALEQVKNGSIIVMGAKGEASRCLTPELKNCISILGSTEINRLGYRDSWAMMVKKGSPHTCQESRGNSEICVNHTW